MLKFAYLLLMEINKSFFFYYYFYFWTRTGFRFQKAWRRVSTRATMSALAQCKSTTPCPSPTAGASTAPPPSSAVNQSIVLSSCPPTSRSSPAPAPPPLPPPPLPPCSSHPRRQSRFQCRRAGGVWGGDSGQFTNICACKITKFSILSN